MDVAADNNSSGRWPVIAVLMITIRIMVDKMYKLAMNDAGLPALNGRSPPCGVFATVCDDCTADAIFAKSTVCCNRAFKKQKLLVIYFIFVGRFGKNLIEENEWFERKIGIALWTRQLNGKWHFH